MSAYLDAWKLAEEMQEAAAEVFRERQPEIQVHAEGVFRMLAAELAVLHMELAAKTLCLEEARSLLNSKRDEALILLLRIQGTDAVTIQAALDAALTKAVHRIGSRLRKTLS